MLKPYVFLLAFLFVATTFLSAQLPDSCSVPPLIRHHYLGSAKVLALRQMLGDPALADSVQIPAELYNPVLEALSAVYNAQQFPERDTVTQCLNILAFPAPVSPVALTLTVDTTELWAKKLFLDIFPTGNAMVDDLLLHYQLQKTSSQLDDQYFFVFQVNDPLNTVALAALFNGISGAHAEANTSLGEGNDIVLDTVAGGVTLTYTVRWGDCPAGCIFHRSWTFLVRPNCAVEFVGAQGDPLNAEVACNSIFGCATEPLCLPWLQDSLQHYTSQYPDCLQGQPTINVSLYQDFDTDPVLGIHVFVGIDAEFTDFFYCNGDYIGSCAITIGGPGCMPGSLSHYLQGDTIWTCDQPLPTPANCGVTATSGPAGEPLAFQLSPNPGTAGQVWLRADFGTTVQGRLTVFDVFGKMVTEKTFTAAQLEEALDMARQSPGLYFVRLDTGARTATRKLLLLAP